MSKKGSKYKNVIVEYEGIKFHSKKECKRYKDLVSMQRAGEIKDLELQPKFTLIEGVKFSGQRATPPIRYYADFAYTDTATGERVIEDVKSPITRDKREYKMKRHMMLAIHGIEVVEV